MESPIKLACWALLGFVAAPVCALAQTADETVLFMLFGAEEPSAKRTAQNRWVLPNTDKLTSSERVVAINRIDDCRYIVKFPDEMSEGLFDFSKIQQYSVKEFDGISTGFIFGHGLVLWKARNAANQITEKALDSWSITAEASADRQRKAASHFAATFCKGRAF